MTDQNRSAKAVAIAIVMLATLAGMLVARSWANGAPAVPSASLAGQPTAQAPVPTPVALVAASASPCPVPPNSTPGPVPASVGSPAGGGRYAGQDDTAVRESYRAVYGDGWAAQWTTDHARGC